MPGLHSLEKPVEAIKGSDELLITAIESSFDTGIWDK
jgi:hypothetical protein